MSRLYEIADLEDWDRRIREKACEFGLDCYPQQFEICDQNQMLSSLAYSGIPSHYPHWSYGKTYERQKTLYDHGVSGLPYELVINSNPVLAYLMRDNTLLLQILTIAHVYGHNDFFKNNFTFKTTRPEFTVDTFKAHGDRVRSYVENPGIGLEKVEMLLDAAHSIALQCRRNLAIRKRTPEEEREVLTDTAHPPLDPFQRIHRRSTPAQPDLKKVPPVPDQDLLLFIRDHNPNLSGWERDILTIVHEESQYFIPQIETKLMNEGWATYWHKRILDSLDLPEDLQLEFIVRHNQVVRPLASSLNPYHVGLAIWQDIDRRCHEPVDGNAETSENEAESEGTGRLFEVRESDRDSSFLRRHLTEELIRDLNLYEYQTKEGRRTVRNVADRDGWRQVKETLLRNVGIDSVPVIKVVDADFGHRHTLYLVHDHDGRDLELEYADKTLAHITQLWGGEVVLETVLAGDSCLLKHTDSGCAVSALA
ncbi:MAG TPA: SpoVR family protein [Acidobacteriota bacterium]|nr:SpoVR family protein [Acidobacteriota bacterium]